MKKIHYLLTIAAIAITGCQKQPIVGLGGSASSEVKAMTITLASTDYTKVGSGVYAYNTKSFASDADAKMYIPTILNSEYPQLSDGSTASVTFTEQPVLADSIFADQKYTLVTTPTNDYKLLPGNSFSDFTVAQTLSWLPYKFTAPVQAQEEILTLAFYNGSATVAGTVQAYLYTNGAWLNAYLVSPAQYTSISLGTYDQFTSSNTAASITGYLNVFLKSDPNVMAVATVGTVEYVSYNYYNAAKATTQRVMALVYNGSNWVATNTTTLNFLKSGGTWIADPTVYYTITTADIALLNGTSVNTAVPIANVIQYGDFNVESSSQYYWSPAQLQAAMIVILTHDFPSPKINIAYKISYLAYTGTNNIATLTFINNGTAWVAQ